MPEEIKNDIAWSFHVSGDRWIVQFCSQPSVAGPWLGRSGCQALGKSACASWRGGSGFAWLLRVPPALVQPLRRIGSGGGGSRHPANYLSF